MTWRVNLRAQLGCAETIGANVLNDVLAQKFPLTIFLNLPRRKVMIYFCQKGKNNSVGITDFVLERTYPEKYPKSEKSGFVS